ncbi:uncharacterized protein atk [Macrobrachium rosenbergii]|uniref:uncharacterized protein atk n=1 Tax=Macrobrachium rosenbergii TaxID=79674 RepID=UPI0034D5D2C8
MARSYSRLRRTRKEGFPGGSPAFLWTILLLLIWPSFVATTSPSSSLTVIYEPEAGDRLQAFSLSCPPEGELQPCKCQLRGPEIHVKCENSVLDKVMRALETLMKRVLVIEELHLVGNRIHVLPARVFGSLQVNKLFLINNELVGINRNAFAGLESSLQHIYITDPELFNMPFDALDNLANLRTCVLENTDITEIPRLYSLSKLEFLKIDGSRVANIPTAAFRFMPNMKKVHIANSRLKEIHGNALEGLVYLKEVNFSNNVIDWIHPRAFRTLTTLEQLTLSGNNLVDVTMAVLAARDLRELRILDLSYNKITELAKGTFVDMPTVQVINLSYNQISRIEHGAVFRLSALSKLDLRGNKLNEFHADIFTESPTMEHLNVAQNNLTFLAEMIYIARALPNLRSLDVSRNRLTSKSFENFGGHRKLEALKLNHNSVGKMNKGMFRDLPNLRELYMSHNSIKSSYDGQVWNLPKLRVLDISHNDLEIVDVLLLEGISQLSTLDISFNMIANIGENAFTGLTYLENLNMSFNSITKIPKNAFSELGELFELELSFNELMSLENGMFKGLTSLQYLHITHNQVITIEEDVFLDTPNLKFLELSSNFVQNIPKEALTKLSSLVILKLGQNVINKIPEGHLSGLRIVEHLDLSKNHIQTLSETAFRDMSVLRDLDLSANFIQSLHPDMFSNTKLLEKLNISHNYISHLGESTFTNSKRLRILDITNNSLTELGEEVRGLLALQGLFMSHNYISSLKNTTFQDLPNLSVLKFDNNGLQTFEPGTFSDMSSLVSLDLRNNNLVELNPDSIRSLHALKELQISKNQISVVKDFAFSDLSSLRSLELQDNVITDIGDHAFLNMPSLNFLNLSRNGLQEVPSDALARLPSLDVLDMSGNYLLQIRDDSFRWLEWLTVLMLHDNDLCRLSDGAFAKQKALRVLTLNNNQLRRLHLKALGNTITGLSLLDMSGNPFKCDCELVWLKEYLNEDPDDYRIPRTAILGESLRGIPVCASPSEYEGLPITEVPVEAFICSSRLINDEKENCVPRFLDPLLFTAGHQGGGALDTGAVNTLLHLTNLSDTIPQGATGPSYLDVDNPIHVHNLHDIDHLQKPTKVTTTEKPPATAGAEQNVEAVKLPSNDQDPQQLLSSSSIHTVTGDTPTIYAGSSGTNHVDDVKIQDSNGVGGGLFSGIKLPTLPNILESLSNLNLPHIGLNVNWASLPTIGRQESGYVTDYDSASGPAPPPEIAQLPFNKPMKGPDGNKPIWIDGPVSPHPLFPAPPPPPPPPPSRQDLPPPSLDRGPSAIPGFDNIVGLVAPAVENTNIPSVETVLSPDFSSANEDDLNSGIPGTIFHVGRPTNVWRTKPNPGQAESSRPAEQPNQNQRRKPSQPTMTVLPPATHAGPGPNSGTPFLPGLSSHQQRPVQLAQPIVINHGNPQISQNPSLPIHPSLTTSNSANLPSPVDASSGARGTVWDGPQWSHPEVIHPHSGVSLYQPGEPFQPYQPEDPNHPITVVEAPDVSVLHHGTPTAPPAFIVTKSTTFTLSSLTPKPPADMAPSESQVIDGNLSSGTQKETQLDRTTSLYPGLPESDDISTALTPGLESTVIDFSASTVMPSVMPAILRDQGIQNNSTELPLEVQANASTTQSVLNTANTSPTLGDLLDLLYAAEEEVQEERSSENISLPDVNNLPLTTTPEPFIYTSTPDTNSSLAKTQESPVFVSSTTEMLPPLASSSTSSSTATTTDFFFSSTESATTKNTDENSNLEPVSDSPPLPALNTYPPQPASDTYPPQTASDKYPPQLASDSYPPQPASDTYPPQPPPETYPPPPPPQPGSDSYPLQPAADTFPQPGFENYPPQTAPETYPPLLGDGVTVLKDLPPDVSLTSSSDNFPANDAALPNQQQDYYGPYADDNDSYQSPFDHPHEDSDWPSSSERTISDSSTPTRYRPGFIVPVDKSGDPLPGARTRPNNTYISPSKSIGRGGIPTIERVKIHNNQQETANEKEVTEQTEELPHDSGASLSDFAHEEVIPNTEFDANDGNAIDWYYSNYFREYDPYAQLPVGGNKPKSSAGISRGSCIIYIASLVGIWLTCALSR